MQQMNTPEQFPFVHVFTPRWRDNDQYVHLNNAVYYEYFDSIANIFLIEHAGLRPDISPHVAYVVYSQYQYFAPLSYPERMEIGLAVKKLGNSSVTWLSGIFNHSESGAKVPELKAIGELVHVFVERSSGEKSAIPDSIRSKLMELQIFDKAKAVKGKNE